MKAYKDLKEVLKHVWRVDENRNTGADDEVETPMADPAHQLRSSANQHRFTLESLPAHLERFNPSIAELSTMLGDDWADVAASPYLLARYVHLLRETKMIAVGVVPPSFREIGYCQYCGEIPLNVASEPLVGCPWCHSDKKPELVN